MTQSLSLTKRILTILICLCFIVVCFAGCSLWTLNETKYENQVVAKMGDTSVNLKEVYDAYYSYGNYYYDGQGNVTYDGIKRTAQALLNRKILSSYLKDGAGKITLTQAQVNEVWESTYSSINSSILSIEKTLYSSEDMDVDFDTKEDEEKVEAYEKPYESYNRTYEYAYNDATGKYELRKVETTAKVEKNSLNIYHFTKDDFGGQDPTEERIQEKLAIMTKDEQATKAYDGFREYYWDGKNDTKTDSEGKLYSERAFNKYIAQLKTATTDKSLNMNSANVFYREAMKIYEDAYNSKLISVFQEEFAKTDLISKTLVLETFNRLAESNREKYSLEDEDGKLSAYTKAMQDRSSPVIYYDHSEDWFQVSHVLLKFDTNTVAKLKALKTKLENNSITEEDYEKLSNAIKNDATFVDRGDPNKKAYTAKEVLSMLQNDLRGKSEKMRIQIFNDYIYRFNMDTGANNASFAYYIPGNKDDDTMVTPFANESRNLRAKGVASVSDLIELSEVDGYIDNSGETKTPGYSGYHIIIYLGEIQTLNTQGYVTVEQLDNFVLNPLNDNTKYNKNEAIGNYSKTMLDYVIEQITYDHYSAYQSGVLQTLQGDNEFVDYSAVINELVKKFSTK